MSRGASATHTTHKSHGAPRAHTASCVDDCGRSSALLLAHFMAAPTLHLAGTRAPPIQGKIAGWNGAPTSREQLGPMEKLLHFTRHAQGTHNLDPTQNKMWASHDAKLTPDGIDQCMALQKATQDVRPQLVVASPMTRTLQTATHCFDLQRKASSAPPIVALEQLRETINFLCDSRRSITAIRSELPDVDYSHVIHDEDFLWASYEKEHGLQEDYGGLRETKNLGALRARAAEAMAWLGARPEKEIVVVSHCAFLRHLLAFGHERGDLGTQPPVVEYENHDVKMYMKEYVSRRLPSLEKCDLASSSCPAHFARALIAYFPLG